MTRWLVGDGWIGNGRRPAVMGILNVTTDSFFDGGRFCSVGDAADQAELMARSGADLIDVGGESTRPGAAVVSLAEELDRVLPVIEAVRRRLPIPLSIDTSKTEVARAAVAAGATIINDITGLGQEEMLATVAGSCVGVVIMHIQGTPQTMQVDPRYEDVVAEVVQYLTGRVQAAGAVGIERDRIAVDPGVGFGKTLEHNMALLRNLDQLEAIGCPILTGTSRKGFLGRLTGKEVGDRLVGSVASALGAATNGASIVRVHDVAATVEAFKVWEAQVGWRA